jgi:hypothetical protein
MILARITFHAKFGKAGQVVQMLKQSRSSAGSDAQQMRILTDLGGRFDTVTLERVAESMAEMERGRAAMFASPQYQESGSQMQELIDWGSIEFYTIED